EQAAEPGIARAALENAVVAVFDRDVVVAAVPDGPVTDPDIVAELGEGGAGAGLGHLHAGAVVGEPGCVVLQLLAQAAAGDGVDQGAVAPVPAAAAATDRQRDGVLDPQVDVIEVSRQPHPPGTGSGVGRRAGLFGAAAPLVADRGAVWGVQTQADAAVPVVGRRRDRATGAEVEVVVQRIIVVDVVPGIDLGVGAHLHAGAAAVHQFAAHDVGRAVHMVDLVAVVVGAVAQVGGRGIAGVLRHVEDLDAAADGPAAAVAVVALAAVGIPKVDHVALAAVAGAGEVERAVHGGHGRAVGHRRARAGDPRVVFDRRVVVDGVAGVGLVGDVEAGAAAGAAAAAAAAHRRQIRVGHGLERHRTRVIEDEHDVRLDVSGAGLQREVREALAEGRIDRQREQGGAECHDGGQGLL